MSNNIEHLFSQVTFKYAQSSLFMLLQNCYSLTSDSNKNLIYPVSEKMEEITKKIVSYTFMLPEKLTDDEQKNIDADLTSMHEQITKIARELTDYNKTSSMASSICVANSNNSVDEPASRLTIHDDIFERCHQYIKTITPDSIANVGEGLDEALNMGALLSYLPIKMTKEKYYDYIRRALDIFFKDMSCQSIKDIVPLLKLKFFHDEGENVYFPQAKKDLLELVNRAEKLKTFDEGDELLSDIEIFQDWLSQMTILLDMQHESLSFLLLIRLIASDFNILFDENIIYKDIYYSTKENLLGDNRLLFEENALSTLEECSESCVDEIHDFEESLLKKLNKMKSADNSTAHLSQIFLTIKNIYFSSLCSSMYYLNTSFKDDDEDNSDCINEAVSSVLGYIKDKLSPLPVKQQRFLREAFFDAIPSPFSHEEFFEYALLSLNTCSSSKQKSVLALISDLFSRVNLDMHHEHSCDCGHEHSHDNNHQCDCGHEH